MPGEPTLWTTSRHDPGAGGRPAILHVGMDTFLASVERVIAIA